MVLQGLAREDWTWAGELAREDWTGAAESAREDWLADSNV